MGLLLTFISHNGHRLVHKQFVWLIKLILQKDYITDVKTVSKAEKRRCVRVCLSQDYWRTHLFIVVTYGGIYDVVFTYELSLQ